MPHGRRQAIRGSPPVERRAYGGCVIDSPSTAVISASRSRERRSALFVDLALIWRDRAIATDGAASPLYGADAGYRLQGLPGGHSELVGQRQWLSVAQGVRAPSVAPVSGAQHRREHAPLSVGHRPERLLLGHGQLGEELVAAGLTPAALADQQVGHRHAVRLPRAVDDHLGDVDLAGGHPALELGAGEADLVGTCQGTHVLWTGRGDWRCRVHGAALPVSRRVAPAARNVLVS